MTPHLELLLYHFHVVSLQEVLLLQAHLLQLGEKVAEHHRCHRLVIDSRVPENT